MARCRRGSQQSLSDKLLITSYTWPSLASGNRVDEKSIFRADPVQVQYTSYVLIPRCTYFMVYLTTWVVGLHLFNGNIWTSPVLSAVVTQKHRKIAVEPKSISPSVLLGMCEVKYLAHSCSDTCSESPLILRCWLAKSAVTCIARCFLVKDLSAYFVKIKPFPHSIEIRPL